MQQATQTFLEVPIRHESEHGTVLDLEQQKTYVISQADGTATDFLGYNTPLPEFIFDSYFSMADTNDYNIQTGKDMHTAVEMAHTQTVTSLQLSIPNSPEPEGGFHKPVLDIDFPAALLPSSTVGHYHLYLDKEVIWDDYVDLLKALAKCGIIEQGYANASIDRGHTAVRLPWVKKPHQQAPIDARRMDAKTIDVRHIEATDEAFAEPFVEPVAAPGKIELDRPSIAERRAAKLQPAGQPYNPNPWN